MDVDRPLLLSLGEIEVNVIARDGDVWWLSRPSSGEEQVENSDAWIRWVAETEAASVDLVPRLPDRPVVVQPEIPFHIAPRSRAQIYVGIPLWASLQTTGIPSIVIAEFPVRDLSNTWWGDTTEGELAYRIATNARRQLLEIEAPEEIAVCRMDLVNESEDTLPVARISVRAPQLAVFRGERGFWTNEVRVTFTDHDGGSQIQILERAPGEAGKVTPASLPRDVAPTRWRAHTFLRLVRSGMN